MALLPKPWGTRSLPMLEQNTKQVARYRGWFNCNPQNSRPRQLGNQPPNATSYPQTPICKGGHLCHPIQLARFSSLISHHQPWRLLQSGIRSLFLGQLGPSPKSCPPERVFSPSTLLLLRLSIPRPIEPPSTLPNSKIKCLHARESRKKRRRSCRLCLATKARKKKSKALFLTSCIALSVRVVNWCQSCCSKELLLCSELWIVN